MNHSPNYVHNNLYLHINDKESYTMKKIIITLCSILFISTLSLLPTPAFSMSTKYAANSLCNTRTTGLKMNERKLWSDHVLWTRNFIISSLANLEDKPVVATRLLKNQDDIGNSIKPYYGEEAGETLSKLLREHILIAVDVVDAAKNNNQVALEKSNKRWYKNADDIALFLSKANPYWSYKTMQNMLYTHLQLTTDEVVARIKKDWGKDIISYDVGEEHMLKFADALSKGMINQFPQKFTSQ